LPGPSHHGSFGRNWIYGPSLVPKAQAAPSRDARGAGQPVRSHATTGRCAGHSADFGAAPPGVPMSAAGPGELGHVLFPAIARLAAGLLERHARQHRPADAALIWAVTDLLAQVSSRRATAGRARVARSVFPLALDTDRRYVMTYGHAERNLGPHPPARSRNPAAGSPATRSRDKCARRRQAARRSSHSVRPERTGPEETLPVQNGGSARGYQGLPAPLAIPATATQTAARSYFYASPALA